MTGTRTAPERWSVAHTLEEVATRIADLAHAIVEGVEAGSRFFGALPRRDGSYRIVYPTRMNTAGLVRKALAPFKAGWLGAYGKTEDFPEGLTLPIVLHRAYDIVLADPGDDDEVLDVLVELNDAIQARVAKGEDLVDAAEDEIGGAHEGSLWWAGVVAALPYEPQTPGSPKWLEEEERAKAQGRVAKHESRPNPF